MNPFDLPGPPFLVFYWTLSTVSLLLVYWLYIKTDVISAAPNVQADPYMLAYLRAGHEEVVRVALLVLIDDGVIAVEERNLSLAAGPTGKPRRIKPRSSAIEGKLIKFVAAERSTDVYQIVSAGVAQDECLALQSALERSGHLRRHRDLARLRTLATAFALVLPGIAIIKMSVAFTRGKTNVGFLLISAIVAFTLASKLRGEAITTRGKNALQATAALLKGARDRLASASTAMVGPELALLAATFGFTMFNRTTANFAFWPALASPRDRTGTQQSGWISSNSSCSSSSCSTTVSSCGGGGSSCGGGGGCGGGGCGGCGGE